MKNKVEEYCTERYGKPLKALITEFVEDKDIVGLISLIYMLLYLNEKQ